MTWRDLIERGQRGVPTTTGETAILLHDLVAALSEAAAAEEWFPPDTAPIGVQVLVDDRDGGICAGQRVEVRPGDTYWSPVPVSVESDEMHPIAWRHLPKRKDAT